MSSATELLAQTQSSKLSGSTNVISTLRSNAGKQFIFQLSSVQERSAQPIFITNRQTSSRIFPQKICKSPTSVSCEYSHSLHVFSFVLFFHWVKFMSMSDNAAYKKQFSSEAWNVFKSIRIFSMYMYHTIITWQDFQTLSTLIFFLQSIVLTCFVNVHFNELYPVFDVLCYVMFSFLCLWPFLIFRTNLIMKRWDDFFGSR